MCRYLGIGVLAVHNMAEASDWSSADIKREAAYQALHWMDYAQTRHIGNNCDRYAETNPVLGRCPSGKKIAEYFLATSLLHWGISYALNKEGREGWQYGTVVIEALVVGNNARIGIKMDF